MKNFIVYNIYSQPFNIDLLSGMFWELDISGLIEEIDHLKLFAEESSDISLSTIEKILEKLKKENILTDFRIETEILEDKNWNEEWEKSRGVINVSDRIVIKPSFKVYQPKANEIVMMIDPKMSFGTGEHQTTKLVLRLLEKLVMMGSKVLDVGSGTGILSIAAVKLGANKAIAVDTDEICLENCKENCLLNSVQNSVEILTGDIDAVKQRNFDLIVANIQKNVLIDIAQKIKARLNPDGKIILSGLLESDKNEIEACYHSLGISTEQITQLDEWIAIVFGKNSD